MGAGLFMLQVVESDEFRRIAAGQRETAIESGGEGWCWTATLRRCPFRSTSRWSIGIQRSSTTPLRGGKLGTVLSESPNRSSIADGNVRG